MQVGGAHRDPQPHAGHARLLQDLLVLVVARLLHLPRREELLRGLSALARLVRRDVVVAHLVRGSGSGSGSGSG